MLSWLQLLANMRRRVILAAILSEVIKMNQTMQDYSESQKSSNDEQKKLLEEISKGMEGLCYQLEAAVTSRDISGLQNLSTTGKELAGKLKAACAAYPPKEAAGAQSAAQPTKDELGQASSDNYGGTGDGEGDGEASDKEDKDEKEEKKTSSYVSKRATGKK